MSSRLFARPVLALPKPSRLFALPDPMLSARGPATARDPSPFSPASPVPRAWLPPRGIICDYLRLFTIICAPASSAPKEPDQRACRSRQGRQEEGQTTWQADSVARQSQTNVPAGVGREDRRRVKPRGRQILWQGDLSRGAAAAAASSWAVPPSRTFCVADAKCALSCGRSSG